jgi:Leucine-rich repeat (LRR) protein
MQSVITLQMNKTLFFLSLTFVVSQSTKFLELTCNCEVPSSCASRGFTHFTVDENTSMFLLGCERLIGSDIYELNLSYLSAGLNRTLSAFTNLVILKVSKSFIKTLNEKLFDGLTLLENLYMSGNEIEVLPAFPELDKLIKIHLPSNRIEIIREKNFRRLKVLTSLNLESNNIFYIHSKAFAENKKLKEINLNRNSIQFIESGTFDCNVDLVELTMNYNNFRHLPSRIFENNKQLEVLQLHSNAIESLEKDIFSHNGNLRWIEMSENRIVFIHQNVFSDLKNLEFVNFAWNDCIDDSYPIEMTFEHFLRLINRNCHVLAVYYFDL